MIAKFAYLTTPAPNVFVLNIQEGGGEFFKIEISRAHLANILIDGCALALRTASIHRVPEASDTRETA